MMTIRKANERWHSNHGWIETNRAAWLQAAEGEIVLNGKVLLPGDGAALEKEPKLQISAVKPSQILLFDLN